MTEETLTPPVQTSTEEINTTPATSTPSSPLDKEKNMLGIVALVTAIIGLLLTLSIFGSIVGIPLLILALLLGIIAVFRRPRGNATASIIIAFLPLGIFTYFAYQISTIIIEPIKDFSTWAYEQSTIPERNAVANQPWFDEFFRDRIEARFQGMYWNITSQNRPQGSIKDQLLYYINYSLNEFKAELSSSIDAWVAKYGRPEGTQGLTWPTNASPLTNTSRMLREFDGQPVDGSYTLSFDATSLSAKLCNTVGGDFSTTDDILHTPQLISTQMFCLDEEANTLEAAFQPDGASFSLVSTRMATNNLERLALTTLEGHIFLYTNILAPIEGLDTAEVLDILQEDAPLIGGQQDEHGCYLGAGYARNEEAQECQRPREQAEDTSGNDEIIQDVEAILNALDENN